MAPQTLTPREILDRLVAFPTVSRESNLDLVDWVEAYLNGHGVTAHRVWNADRTKASIYANIGPEVAGGTVLSGHTDVVPVNGQSWSTDPFVVTEKDGRLYGRGTCDMKGFDALALAAVPMALAKGIKRPLQIALSYDEEVGCIGAPPMIADMVQRLPKASAVVVGEPSMMKLVNGHKGGAGYNVHVTGFEVHSSLLPYGVSAIMEAARLVGWMNDRNTEIRSLEPSALAAMFHPPFTTIHCGKFAGGTAANITAGACDLTMEFRVVPGEDPDRWAQSFETECARLSAAMQRIQPEAGITLDRFFDVPALAPEDAGEAEALVRRVTGDNGTSVVSYGTEAGQFQAEGYSCVVCGPGDIAQAHQANEYCTVAQFEAGWAFMDKLTDDLAD